MTEQVIQRSGLDVTSKPGALDAALDPSVLLQRPANVRGDLLKLLLARNQQAASFGAQIT